MDDGKACQGTMQACARTHEQVWGADDWLET